MNTETKRDKYPTKTFLLAGPSAVTSAIKCINYAPIDTKNPIEIVIREQVKSRKLDQNSLMWSGPLKDISTQAYLNGRTFSDKIWHEYFKKEFLPDENEMPMDELVRHVRKPESYKKWDFQPNGERICAGSTADDLTIYGMSIYLEQIHAYGASEFGVMFRVSPKEQQRYAA